MQLKTLYTLFFLGVFMFVAKPFIGFSLSGSKQQLIESHSLLEKSFSKRKPEDIEDAKAKASSIRQLLTHPPLPLLLTIVALLSVLFTLTFKRPDIISGSFLNGLRLSLVPADQPYLLTGKLSI